MTEPIWTSRTLPIARGHMLTANDKLHWARRASLTKQLRRWGYFLGCEGRGVECLHLARARVVFEVAYPDRRRRDRHNLAPTIKAMLDGLIDAGLLPDDADRYLDGPYTVIADRFAMKRLGVPMYEVRVLVYADTEKE